MTQGSEQLTFIYQKNQEAVNFPSHPSYSYFTGGKTFLKSELIGNDNFMLAALKYFPLSSIIIINQKLEAHSQNKKYVKL